MRTLSPHELRFGAGLSRLVMAGFALVFLPILYPSLAAMRPLFVAYALVAVVQQVLILKQIGGVPRAVLGGILDAAMLTFLIHWVGSGETYLVAVYVYAALMNTLVVGREVGRALAIIACAMYCTVLGLEVAGVLPYAPGGTWVRPRPYTVVEALVIATMTCTLLLLASTVTGKLLELINDRENELRAMNLRLEELSIRDPLTDLYNRRHLMERLDAALREHTAAKSFAVIMLDLDGFKRVNDTLGHAHGDALLREIAGALTRSVRPGDLVCRYGGDELVVLLWRTREDEAEPRARELADVIRDVGRRFAPDLPVTASVGVAMPHPGEATPDLLRRADENAYLAKRAGGDRVVAVMASA